MANAHEVPPSGPARSYRPGQHPPPGGDGADLRALLGRLNRDATQLMHDELELAKIELRDVADAFADEVQAAGEALARDLAKIGVALSLGTLAGLALTTGAILAVGRLLGGAFWAGGLIVGTVLLLAAAAFGWSAARDLRDNRSLRLEKGRRTLRRDGNVLRDEANRMKDFAEREASDFKREASRDA